MSFFSQKSFVLEIRQFHQSSGLNDHKNITRLTLKLIKILTEIKQ